MNHVDQEKPNGVQGRRKCNVRRVSMHSIDFSNQG